MKIDGIVETALHVEDVSRSAAFYEQLFQLRRLAFDDRLCAFAVPGGAVLLLFQKGATLEPIYFPGGMVPPHDGSGRMHFAFKISEDDIEACERELEAAGVAIESRVSWPLGGKSLYFRDPDQHLVELITPG